MPLNQELAKLVLCSQCPLYSLLTDYTHKALFNFTNELIS